ncbi:hypothetical protein Tco_0098086 [Tanacetum coccineum]
MKAFNIPLVSSLVAKKKNTLEGPYEAYVRVCCLSLQVWSYRRLCVAFLSEKQHKNGYFQRGKPPGTGYSLNQCQTDKTEQDLDANESEK